MLLRVLESVHGHLGLAAAIALLHPAILLRRGAPLSRGGRWSVALTTAVVATAFGLGISLYAPYRAEVKRELFAASTRMGLAFETKEHLAYVVAALAAGGAAAALLARPPDVATRRAAALAFAGAALACLVVVALGVAAAAVRSF